MTDSLKIIKARAEERTPITLWSELARYAKQLEQDRDELLRMVNKDNKAVVIVDGGPFQHEYVYSQKRAIDRVTEMLLGRLGDSVYLGWFAVELAVAAVNAYDDVPLRTDYIAPKAAPTADIEKLMCDCVIIDHSHRFMTGVGGCINCGASLLDRAKVALPCQNEHSSDSGELPRWSGKIIHEVASPNYDGVKFVEEYYQTPEAPSKRWPFVESPGDFAKRLRGYLDGYGLVIEDVLAAVRTVLIEQPPTFAPWINAEARAEYEKSLKEKIELSLQLAQLEKALRSWPIFADGKPITPEDILALSNRTGYAEKYTSEITSRVLELNTTLAEVEQARDTHFKYIQKLEADIAEKKARIDKVEVDLAQATFDLAAASQVQPRSELIFLDDHSNEYKLVYEASYVGSDGGAWVIPDDADWTVIDKASVRPTPKLDEAKLAEAFEIALFDRVPVTVNRKPLARDLAAIATNPPPDPQKPRRGIVSASVREPRR